MAKKTKTKNRKAKTYYGKRRVSKIHAAYRWGMLIASIAGAAGVGYLWYMDRQEVSAKLEAYDADVAMRQIIAEAEVDAQIEKMREEKRVWDELPPPEEMRKTARK